MKGIWKSFLLMGKQTFQDAMLVILCLVPFLAGALFKFGIPRLETFLCIYFEKTEIIAPFYGLLDVVLIMLPMAMFSMAGALVILGEMDDNIATYMSITPVGKKGYVISRLVCPVFIATLFSIFTINVFGISDMPVWKIVMTLVFSILLGIDMSFLIIACSANKVEGMAFGKLSGILMLGVVIPYFVKTKEQFLFCIMPSFWFGRFLTMGGIGSFILTWVVFLGWTVILYRRYKQKI